jgi:hypothetical protein
MFVLLKAYGRKKASLLAGIAIFTEEANSQQFKSYQ